MPDAPFITGSELISNPGNPALGYSSGVSYNSNPNVEQPFGTGIQSSLLQLQQQEAYERQQKAAQAIKDRDALGEYLAGTGQSAFNMRDENGKDMSFSMLPQDRDLINSKADELRKKIVQNPQTYRFDPEIKKMQDEFNQLKHHAGMRAIDYAQKQQLIAKSNDPEERNAILNNIDQEIGQKKVDEFHLPNPYRPLPQGDITKVGVPADVLSGKDKNAYDDINIGTQKDANGNEVQVTYPGIRASVLDVRSKLIPGSPEYVQAANMVSRYYSNPSLMSAQNVLTENANIDKYNADRGLTPGSPNYANHIANVLPNGQVVPKPINARSVGDITYSLLAGHAGQLGREAKITKTASEVAKQNLEKQNEQANIAHTKATTAKVYQDIKTAKDKGDEESAHIKGVTLPVVKLMQYAGEGKDLSELMKYNNPAAPVFNQLAVDGGVNPEDYTASKLGSSQDLIKIAGIQGQDAAGKTGKNLVAPQYAYLLKSKDGDPNKSLFVVGYQEMVPQIDKDGNVEIDETTKKPVMKPELKVKKLSPSEAISNVVTYSDRSDDKIMDGALDYWKELNPGNVVQGGQRIPDAAPVADIIKNKEDNSQVPAAIKSLGKILKSRKAPNGQTYYRIEGKPGKLFRADGSDGTNDLF